MRPFIVLSYVLFGFQSMVGQPVDQPCKVIDNGGGLATGGMLRLHSSIGQSVVGLMTTPGFSLQAGYIHCIEDHHEIPEFNLGTIAVFATNSIWLRDGSDILSGHIGVNTISPGPMLDSQVELSVGQSVTTPEGVDLRANRIKIKHGALVESDVYYNTLTNNGTLSGLEFTPLTLPILSSLPAFPRSTPGSLNITVEPNDSISLDAGDYGEISIKTNGKILFTGGTYNIRRIDGASDVNLLFAAPSEVRISEKFDTDEQSYVGPASASGITAGDILFVVEGINGSNGNLGSTPRAAQIGMSNSVAANFLVPNGTLWLRDGTSATGSFVGRDVIVGINVQVVLDSYFDTPGSAPLVQSLELPGATMGLKTIPAVTSLNQNFPNPFNPVTAISYDIAVPARVTLAVFNLLGEKVAQLVNQYHDPGKYKTEFDATSLASGVYVYRLQAGSFVDVKKMIVLK